MKETPKGWPRLSAALFYEDPRRAIDWLCKAFGFEVRLKVEGEGGKIEHSELVFGEALLMVGGVGEAGKRPTEQWMKSPRMLGGANTGSLMFFVDDVDQHCARARAAGATIAMEPTTNDYGADYWTDRTYQAVDPEGHRFWFVQRLRG